MDKFEKSFIAAAVLNAALIAAIIYGIIKFVN
jgi:hypothetical protein